MAGNLFGGLADFSASANIKSAINLVTGISDIITHVNQVSKAMSQYVTRMKSQDGNPCMPSVVLIPC